ncbi:MAG: glycosyltransferase family 2 protein, partial [Saprospiraceae bacterium]|nr:glycosyltransferase family 2 protein [Saprospiraceae bacterium]
MERTAKPDISLIICTYNRIKFLPECLDSCAAQDLPNDAFEIIVINNNCTDGTTEFVNGFIQRHPGLGMRHFIETQQGLSYARNRGIKESKGDIIVFIDDDAIVKPDYLRLILGYFESHHDMKGGGGKVVAKFESGKPHWYNKFSAPMFCSEHLKGDAIFKYKEGDYPFGCNMFFHRSVIDSEVYFDPALGRKGTGLLAGEEKAIFKRIQQAGHAIYYFPEIMALHQIDDYRMEQTYLDNISIGNGASHKLMYSKLGTLRYWMHG